MRKIILLVFTIIISFTIYAQEKTISGIITDETGPLPGATILIKGTTTDTQTDFDGNYTIKTEIGDILVFSYMGYITQEIIVTASSTIDVAFKVDSSLFYCCLFSKPKQIGINYYGGFDNTSYGFLLEYFHSYLEIFNSEISFGTKFGYKTDFKSNKQFYSELMFDNIIPNFDIKLVYTNVENESYNFQKYQIESSKNFNFIFKQKTVAYLGLGISELNSKNWQNGYEVGIGQNLPLGIQIYSKVTYWNNYWQFQNGLDWAYRNFNLFVEFDKILNYNNLNIGLGYNIIL